MMKHFPISKKHALISLTTVILITLGAIALNVRNEAARQTKCTNRLKMIGLAIINSKLSGASYPLAAISNDKLLPEKRLSWQLSVLNNLFCPDCWGLDDYYQIDRTGPWDVGPQRRFAVTPLEPLLCPSSPYQSAHASYSGMHPIDRSHLTENAPTSDIGISGLGKDAAFLPKGDPNCGVFGYARSITDSDITDGLSTTMMVAETTDLQAPWTAGGPQTVRGVDPTKRPYIGTGRQFGGNHPNIVLVLCADGSVRSVRATVAPEVFEALSTIAGGEPLPLDWGRR